MEKCIFCFPFVEAQAKRYQRLVVHWQNQSLSPTYRTRNVRVKSKTTPERRAGISDTLAGLHTDCTTSESLRLGLGLGRPLEAQSDLLHVKIQIRINAMWPRTIGRSMARSFKFSL